MQQSLAIVLHELVRLLDRSGEVILRRRADISFAQFYLVSAMARLGPSTQRELAAFVGHSDAAVSRMLPTLLAAGWVSSGVERDRRSKTVILTPAGIALVEQAEALLERELSELLESRGVDERRFTELAVGARDALRAVGWSATPARQRYPK